MTTKKVELGKREKEIIDFLKDKPEGIWKSELIGSFAYAAGYDIIMRQRLRNLVKKGLIEIREEYNKETGHMKQRVYLKAKS